MHRRMLLVREASARNARPAHNISCSLTPRPFVSGEVPHDMRQRPPAGEQRQPRFAATVREQQSPLATSARQGTAAHLLAGRRVRSVQHHHVPDRVVLHQNRLPVTLRFELRALFIIYLFI